MVQTVHRGGRLPKAPELLARIDEHLRDLSKQGIIVTATDLREKFGVRGYSTAEHWFPQTNSVRHIVLENTLGEWLKLRGHGNLALMNKELVGRAMNTLFLRMAAEKKGGLLTADDFLKHSDYRIARQARALARSLSPSQYHAIALNKWLNDRGHGELSKRGLDHERILLEAIRDLKTDFPTYSKLYKMGGQTRKSLQAFTKQLERDGSSIGEWLDRHRKYDESHL